MGDEQQSQYLLLKPDPALPFATTVFNPQQVLLLHDKLITQGAKGKISAQNLQRNNVAWQVECFCVSCFAALGGRVKCDSAGNRAWVSGLPVGCLGRSAAGPTAVTSHAQCDLVVARSGETIPLPILLCLANVSGGI